LNAKEGEKGPEYTAGGMMGRASGKRKGNTRQKGYYERENGTGWARHPREGGSWGVNYNTVSLIRKNRCQKS